MLRYVEDLMENMFAVVTALDAYYLIIIFVI